MWLTEWVSSTMEWEYYNWTLQRTIFTIVLQIPSRPTVLLLEFPTPDVFNVSIAFDRDDFGPILEQ